MIVTLAGFEIANGIDRTLRVLGNDSFSLTQTTDEELLLRDGWPTFFTARASRVIPLTYEVTFPACDSLAAALLQARQIPATCPKGGTLTEQLGATLITYASAKVESIRAERRGVSNQFTFQLSATDPDTAALSPLAQMNSTYVANLSAITGLTGGGATKLDGYVTTDVPVGFTAVILPDVGGVIVSRTFRLIAGTTAENTDPSAGALVVRPDDYNASTNAKVWVQISGE